MRRDILPKPMEELVFSMRVGDIAVPCAPDRGFHVIKLVRQARQGRQALRRGSG